MSNKTILDAAGFPLPAKKTKDTPMNLPFKEQYHKLSRWQRLKLWLQACWAGMSMRPPTHICVYVKEDGTPADIPPHLSYGKKKE